jgi:glycosyltransferase involved in cell wall biosynthesis
MKIAVVTPIPTPYRDAFWNVVDAERNIDLHVLYCATSKADRPWNSKWQMNYQHKFLKGWNLLSWRSREDSQYLNFEVFSHLNRIQPEKVIIGGYNHLTMLIAIMWSVINRRDFYMMCETFQLRKRSGIKSLLREKLVKAIGNKSAGGFPTGKAASKYLQNHGWKKCSLSYLPNVPDIVNIVSNIKELRKKLSMLKLKWGISDENIILYVGRLVKKKNVDLLIKAIAGLEPAFRPILVIIGDGDELPHLKTLSEKSGMKNNTRFLGFQEPEVIREWFVIANVFALPSNETWGVAPIEAASAGLNLILSETVGSASEILTRYPKTQIIQEGNIQHWKKVISKVIDLQHDHGDSYEPLTESSKLIQEWSYSSLACEMTTFLNSQGTIIST